MAHPFYTIGHGTRRMDDFTDLLRSAQIGLVVDVRTVPRSRTNPQYNRDVLPPALEPFRIGYEHIAALGGLRGRNRNIAPSVNGFWKNESFHNYADYALGEEFRAGLARLHELGGVQRCVIMCAEALWWRCHRWIITDYLLTSGNAVFHINGSGHIEPASVNEAARPHPLGHLTYPAGAYRHS